MSRERRRLLEEESPAEPGRYGCPMLVRSTFDPRAGVTIPTRRCSLGWAIHDEVDAARCRATESANDCWQLHPERTPVVALPVAEAAMAAEPLPTAAIKVAGD